MFIVLVRVGCSRASDELPHRATSRSEGGEGAEVDDLRINVSRLEARLEDCCRKLDNKDIYLQKRENLLKELSKKIDSFESDLSAIELAEIVSEEWIQIKNFEQAQQFAEMRALNSHRDSASKRCQLLKFFYNFFGRHPPEALLVLKNIFRAEYISSSKWGAVQQLKRAYSAVKYCHFELRSFIRREMERNEVTAALADEELVFFIASAIVVFPLLSAWIWISSLLP